ncbi:hypothetical protein ABES02_00865 [Neobacillus pocheonensis]|uniref:hypothetical protein n=1 Tax=Neobacillus pocheonensis TaxID=363869 RepID=UPI003D27BB28
MAQQELILDYDYYASNQCSFDDLKLASHQLASATQDQFEQIKKEKWFHRVFDMVTFSKKNEKRMANQIGSLAQAQQMIMEILVRLSERDARISDMVVEAFDNIERLTANDVLLAKRFNQLENRCILGITKETDIGDLTEIQGEILGGLLFYLMHHFDQVSENQRVYANQILTYIGAGAQEMDIKASLESIDQIETKKKLLTCCLEYCFLHNCSFHLPEEIEELLEEFDFGNKTIREVKNKIAAMYNLRGVAGFIDKYGNFDVVEEEFYIEMPEVTFEEETIELEEMNIKSILYIPRDELKVIKNRIVHISAYINCEGHLQFDNCIVHYNETNDSDEITLSEGASITFSNCQVHCHSIDKNSFIQGEGDNEFILLNSVFNDCSHFIKMKNEFNLTIQNCLINSPGENFIHDNGWRQGNKLRGEISNTQIYFNDQNKPGDDIYFGNIIYIQGSVKINNCVVRGIETVGREETKLVLFNIASGTYANCNFTNVDKCISDAASISECSFEACKEVIEGTYDSKTKITNCLFKDCQDITRGDDFSIKNCQFVNCKNGIVKGQGITVEFCEFYNLVHDLSGLVADASFEFSCGKHTDSNKISKCLFDGVEINDGFLIQGSTYEKISGAKVFVEDCDFKNCTTKRSTNVIVRQYHYYFGVFDRQIETKPVHISNCKGLDQVNKGKGRAEEIIIRSETPTGVKIGVALAGAVGGLPGLVVGMGVAKLLKNDDMRVE